MAVIKVEFCRCALVPVRVKPLSKTQFMTRQAPMFSFNFARIFLATTLLASATAATAQNREVSEPPEFDQWVSELRTEALEKGIGQATVDAALTSVELNPRVVELDRRQPEFTITFNEYLTTRASETRIERGLVRMAEHREGLRAVAVDYGVQARFIAAIWGLETNYGAFSGGYSVIQSLVTLAHDRRRSSFFRNELFSALKILDEGHIDLENMKGSWAGAMGQGQFMPTSWEEYARDFNGDGRRDIWTTEVDVFASIANYLKRYGWREDMTWGRQVLLPEDFATRSLEIERTEPIPGCQRALKNHSRPMSLADWQAFGARRMDGSDLPERDFVATLVQPGGADGPAYLTYTNYRAILRYNCSDFYALAISHIADGLASGE